VIASLINVFRIPELRRKIFFTLLIIVVFRLGCYVPIPGTSTHYLTELMGKSDDPESGGYLGFIAMITGGRMQPFLFALGIMPYISASIILQLLTTTIPSLEKLAKEGEAGRRKINEYTRYLTVPLCVIQAAFIVGSNILAWRGVDSGAMYMMVCITAMTAGTIFLMWLGELVDEFGIGNGISLIIMAGIVDRLPGVYYFFKKKATIEFQSFQVEQGIGIETILLIVMMFVGVVLGVVLITQAQRRIPIQQAKHTRGRRQTAGGRSFLPLRVNQAGVIPVIFASSLLYIPMYLFEYIHNAVTMHISSLKQVAEGGSVSWIWAFLDGLTFEMGQIFVYTNIVHLLVYVALIFVFCYFWTAISFKPNEMAEHLRDWGSFIPGMRPGRRTAEYLERVMNRITYVGAAFLAVVAIVPVSVSLLTGISMLVTGFLGGTGLLIIVSVALDLVQRVESHLIMRHYEGFLAEGRVRGRR
jgi:preprotein translocase subunit SecY